MYVRKQDGWKGERWGERRQADRKWRLSGAMYFLRLQVLGQWENEARLYPSMNSD